MEAGIDVPEDWRRLADDLVRSRWRRVVVLGASDRGKSTFCRFLGQQLGVAGVGVSLLDADPGQKMLGPPACVTAGSFENAGQCRPAMLYFVGGTDPAARIGSIVAGVVRLASAVPERLLINTSGLVDGPGRMLKRLKIDALCPDHIVAIALGDELDGLLAPLPPIRVHRLAPSPAAHGKSAAARAAARQAGLALALEGARACRLDGLVFEMLERGGSAGESDPRKPRLCSVADGAGIERGLGVLWDADRAGGTATVVTSVGRSLIRRVRVGMIVPEAVLAVLPKAVG